MWYFVCGEFGGEFFVCLIVGGGDGKDGGFLCVCYVGDVEVFVVGLGCFGICLVCVVFDEMVDVLGEVEGGVWCYGEDYVSFFVCRVVLSRFVLLESCVGMRIGMWWKLSWVVSCECSLLNSVFLVWDSFLLMMMVCGVIIVVSWVRDIVRVLSVEF